MRNEDVSKHTHAPMSFNVFIVRAHRVPVRMMTFFRVSYHRKGVTRRCLVVTEKNDFSLNLFFRIYV